MPSIINGRHAKQASRHTECAQHALPRTGLRVAVLGGGAWGTALAAVSQSAGNSVRLWARNPEVAAHLEVTRRHPSALEGCELPAQLRVSADAREVLEGAEVVLFAVPSQAVRCVASALQAQLSDVPSRTVIACSKGIEADSGLLMTEVLSEELGDLRLGALSGPNFAAELMRGEPTWSTLALSEAPASSGHSTIHAPRLQHALSSASFRLSLSHDVVGTQIGGVVKNVVAIACGMARGLGAGENALFGLITRGLREASRLGIAKGARPTTMLGMSGAGDMFLTCANRTSRNFSFGERLASGHTGASTPLVEGAINANTVCRLARDLGVVMPICEAVRSVVHGECDARSAFESLVASPLDHEDALYESPLSIEPSLEAAE